MRACGAPEVRGSPALDRPRLAAHLGLLAVVLLSLFFTSRAHTGQRSLSVAAPQPKPSFVLPDIEGSSHELQKHAGNVVLVHFFATWCEPCREELSSLATLTKGSQGASLSVLAVNVAEVPVRVSRFLATQPVPFPVLLDIDRSVTRAWSVSILPTTFVLDRKLEPRLFVEGDIDWLRPDVLAALESVGTADTTSQKP